ncbi:hypothetical protein FK268_22505 [Tsukamurella sputi]|uniref:Winged helix-turn-helix domain-containing protein n=1 Tax=Tsukamurella sputi TaxID=2591848 RepID=A0A5C5RI77_9ACTN|nr:hypothetical protein [Tsukamurella sputi]TWS21815.1 hypothetical protein FK268_22505 [Tsukamurella sputi]
MTERRDHCRELIPLIAIRPEHLDVLAAQLGISEITTATALGWLRMRNLVVHTDFGYIATPAGIAWHQNEGLTR